MRIVHVALVRPWYLLLRYRALRRIVVLMYNLSSLNLITCCFLIAFVSVEHTSEWTFDIVPWAILPSVKRHSGDVFQNPYTSPWIPPLNPPQILLHNLRQHKSPIPLETYAQMKNSGAIVGNGSKTEDTSCRPGMHMTGRPPGRSADCPSGNSQTSFGQWYVSLTLYGGISFLTFG